MEYQELNTITELVQQMLIYSEPKLPLKKVASELGKPYTTLIRELNPEDEYAKLGADLLLPIMRITKDVRPLQWLAEKMEYGIIKNSNIHPDMATWQEEQIQDTMLLGQIAKLMLADSPYEIVSAEIDKMIAGLQETRLRYRVHCHVNDCL